MTYLIENTASRPILIDTDWITCAADGAIGAEGKVKSRDDSFGDGTVG